MSFSRLEDTFFGHPKFKRLSRVLNISPVLARGHVSTLWSWCLTFAPDGYLGSFSHDDIADAAEWCGDSTLFIGALISCGLLDDTEGLCIHGWLRRAESHRAVQRMRKARSVAKAKTCADNNVECSELCAIEEKRGEEKRRDEKRSEEKRGEERSAEERRVSGPTPTHTAPPHAAERRERSMSSDIDLVISHYRKHYPQRKPGKKERRLIGDRMRAPEHRTVEELCAAIDGMVASPWHQGANDRHRRYDSLALVVRDAAHVDDFLSRHEKPLLSNVGQRTAETLKKWISRAESAETIVEVDHA